jgi:hypothetical protein
MKQLYYANLLRLKDESKKDTLIYTDSKNIIGNILPLIDRTGKIKMPYDFKIYPDWQMPVYDPTFSKSFDECCDLRTQEIIDNANKENKKIFVFWSGGIDSTLILSSIIKNLGIEETKKKVVVFLSISSISENYYFFEQYVSKLNFKNAYCIEDVFSLDAIIVTGEYSDQIFGSDLALKLHKKSNKSYHYHDPYDREKFYLLFSDNGAELSFLDLHENSPYRGLETDSREAWLDLLEESVAQSGLPITSMFDYLWWLNFNFKWQSIYFRLVIRSKNKDVITYDYLKNHLIYYFGSKDFQLWSMKNLDQKIKKSWRSYKFPAKEYIFAFDGNEHYLNYKIKKGSLYQILNDLKKSEAVDSNLFFIDNINAQDYYVKDNWFNNWLSKKNSTQGAIFLT